MKDIELVIARLRLEVLLLFALLEAGALSFIGCGQLLQVLDELLPGFLGHVGAPDGLAPNKGAVLIILISVTCRTLT